jgi:hypothetical protein
MEHGFIYVLGNQSMPKIYKIGFTTKHPNARINELSRATACPTPFELLAYFGCENPQRIEKEIHDRLARFRVNRAREFFMVPADYVLEMIQEYVTEAIYDEGLQYEQFCEERDANYQWYYDHFFEQCADPIDWQPRRKGFD